jgi:hypothetical protein
MHSKLFHGSYSFWGNWKWPSRIVMLYMHFWTSSIHYTFSQCLVTQSVMSCSMFVLPFPPGYKNYIGEKSKLFLFLIFNCCMCLFWSKVVSAAKQVRMAQATGKTARVRLQAVQDFSVLHSIQKSLGSPLQWVPGALYPGAKWRGREADHSPPFSAAVQNGGAIPPLLHMSSWRDA